MALKTAIVAALASLAAAATLSRNKLYACNIQTTDEAAALSGLHLDVWNHRILAGSSVDVRVKTRAEAGKLMDALPGLCSVKNHDVYAKSEETVLAPRATTDPWFSKYQTYDAIIAKLKSLAAAFPGYTTYVPSIGTSIEGRAIPAIVISDKSVSASSKKTIWWNGAQHAREWISPATVMYQAVKLLNNSATAPVSGWLQKVQFVITPMNNPDGYVYTFNGDRLWRKNRRDNGDGTFGVDLNRNWDDHWGYVGASTDTSDETYQGTTPFSEPETLATSKYIASFPNLLSGIDFHSYSQLVLRSWGWTSTPSQNEAILKTLGDGISSAIKSNSGKSYTSELSAGLYPAAGCTDDWMTAKLGMSGWTIELRDTGSYGFQLPASQIVPTGEEIWAAMKYYINFVLTNNIPYNTPPSS